MTSGSRVKRGRKPKPHVAADGTHINGLRRRPSDGKWQLADGRTFVEPDEAKAIRRFYELTGAVVEGVVAGIPIKAGRAELMAIRDEIAALIRRDELRFWSYVAEQIITRPKYVARLTGIENSAT